MIKLYFKKQLREKENLNQFFFQHYKIKFKIKTFLRYKKKEF